MALTPEQILNKHFQTTQFRKGYDERDVDDFLDDVVAEMRALTAQRDDYSGMCRKASPASAASLRESGARVMGRPSGFPDACGASRTIHIASNAPVFFASVRNSAITRIGTSEKAAASGMFPAVPCSV